MLTSGIGIDFGTTNSSVARATDGGSVELAQFPHAAAVTDSYRSLLYLEEVRERNARAVKSWSGPEGIDRYLAAETKGRLIQSLKSFLSSRTLRSTDVFGRMRTMEELVGRIVRDLREKAERQFGIEIRSAVVGRPVNFVGAENEADNAWAQGRLEQAFLAAGFESIQFEMEPVAAAHHYESMLDHDELILIGDFGGGTSDFSVVRVGPGVRRRGRQPADLLGNAGVGLAGDVFDARIIQHIVSPALGAGSQMRSIDKLLPVPSWVYAKLERWHHLSFLKTNDVMNMLKSVQAQALEPEKIAALQHLIREDLGFHLHRAVQKVKSELSDQPRAVFRFADGVADLEAPIERPNRLAMAGCGSDVNPGNPNHYIQTQCFAFPAPANLLGNSGRNILTGPGLVNADLSLAKNIAIRRLSERFRAQWRMEMFNGFNRPNFLPPLNNLKLFDAAGRPVASAGLLDTTATPSRQIQFALKLRW